MASDSTKKSKPARLSIDHGSTASTLYITDEFRLIGVDLKDLDEKMTQRAVPAAEDPPYPRISCVIDLDGEENYPSGSALMKLGSQIFLVGGRKMFQGSRDVYEVDPRAKKKKKKLILSSKMLGQKANPMIVTIEDRAYVFGTEHIGFYNGPDDDEDSTQEPATFEVLQQGSGSWCSLPDPPLSVEKLHLSVKEAEDEQLASKFVIGSRIFVVTRVRRLIYRYPWPEDKLHVFNVNNKEWDEKDVKLASVKASFESAGLQVPEDGWSVGGFDIGEGKHVFLFCNSKVVAFKPCMPEFYAAIVTGTGILLCYQDITGVIFPAGTIPAGFDCYISYIQVLGNLSVCVTMNGIAPDVHMGLVCISKFRLGKQLRIDPAQLSSHCDSPPHSEFLAVLSTENYVFRVDHGIRLARSVLLVGGV
ncbi:hypothetical protein Dimus_019450 [Dionaea muscipula]